jgi:hypothetical protein
MNWRIENATLIIGGKTIPTCGAVKEVLDRGKVLIVLLESLPPSQCGDTNVVGFDASGTQIWRIKEFPRPNGGDNPVKVISVWEDDGTSWAGRVILYFFAGYNAILDESTGAYTIPSGQRPW